MKNKKIPVDLTDLAKINSMGTAHYPLMEEKQKTNPAMTAAHGSCED